VSGAGHERADHGVLGRGSIPDLATFFLHLFAPFSARLTSSDACVPGLQAPEDRPAMDSIIATLDKIGARALLSFQSACHSIHSNSHPNSRVCASLLSTFHFPTWLCAEREHNELTNTILDEVSRFAHATSLSACICHVSNRFPQARCVCALKTCGPPSCDWYCLALLLALRFSLPCTPLELCVTCAVCSCSAGP
jgi:hypothetical protein